MRRKPYWYGTDWPKHALTPRVGRGSRMRRVFPVTLPVEFLVAFDEGAGRWMVKMHRARGPFQWLPFNAVPRGVRAELRRVIEGVRAELRRVIEERMGTRRPKQAKVLPLRRRRA